MSDFEYNDSLKIDNSKRETRVVAFIVFGFLGLFAFLFVSIVILCFCLHFDGIYYTNSYFTSILRDLSSDKTPKELFCEGRYADAKAIYETLAKKPNFNISLIGGLEIYKASSIMTQIYKHKNNTYFRTFFRFPKFGEDNTQNPTGILLKDMSMLFQLPDQIKEEIYDLVEEYKDRIITLDKESLAICYKLCGKYKNAYENFQKYMLIATKENYEKKNYLKASQLTSYLDKTDEIKNLELMINNAIYEIDMNIYKRGLFVEAKKEFEKLAKIEFKDSQNLVDSCYSNVMHLVGLNVDNTAIKQKLDAGLYLDGYYINDLNKIIEKSNAFFKEKYNITDFEVKSKIDISKKYFKDLAEEAYKQNDYELAYICFSIALKNEEADSRIMECAKNISKFAKDVGDTVLFGSYEQDGNLENGSEPIEWIIIKKDNEKALLISKYVLDYKEMNVENKRDDWEVSTLRSWLNKDFYKVAFNEEEKKQMKNIELNAYHRNMSFGKNKALPMALSFFKSMNYEDYVTCPYVDELDLLKSNFCLNTYSVPSVDLKKMSDSDQKTYKPFGFWFRNSVESQHIKKVSEKSMICIDEYGFQSYCPINKKYGVRPQIMIKNSVLN